MASQESQICNPLVSVVMPAYNAERYLTESLDSVLAQTLQNFELIVVDDGSTDKTLEILKSYQNRDDRVRVISRPNTGIVGALNDGLAAAKGEFIARLDADDIAFPERFSKQVAYLNEHPDCVVVGSYVLLIDSEGSPISEAEVMITHKEIDENHINGSPWQIYHTAVLMRRSIAEKIGGYREGYTAAEDVDFFMRMVEHGQVFNLPVPLTKYRQHLSSIGHTSENKQIANSYKAINDARQRRGLAPLKPEEYNTAPTHKFTLADHYRKWSWWALAYGNLKAARKYALAAFKQQPFSVESWRSVYCTLRGY